MKVRIKSNPGTDQFPELKDDLPVVGDVRTVADDLGEKLVRLGLAEAIAETMKAIPKEALKAVPPEPKAKPKNDE